MGLFEKHNTPVNERRTLFWLVCIVVRLLLATAFTVFSLWWHWFPYVVGALGIIGGTGFWYRRKYDNTKSWWYRIVHGFLWLGGGLSAIFVTYYRTPKDTAGAIAAFFYADVIFGIFTASFCPTSWTKKDQLLSNSTSQNRFISISSATLFASKDSQDAWLTGWSVAHALVASGAGIAAYFIDKEHPWIGCLFLSFGIVGWEAFENTNLKLKGRLFNVSKIDSDANLLGDLLIGFSFLWGTAYIFSAAQI